MKRLRERIPRESFEGIFRPMVREFGARTVILRINEAAKTAIPRQTKLAMLMPKLETLIYERSRPKADEELERIWNIYFDDRLEEIEEEFFEFSDELNKNLDQDKLPQDEDKLAAIGKAIDGIVELMSENEFSELDIEAVFRIKAFPEVLDMYLKRREGDSETAATE